MGIFSWVGNFSTHIPNDIKGAGASSDTGLLFFSTVYARAL